MAEKSAFKARERSRMDMAGKVGKSEAEVLAAEETIPTAVPDSEPSSSAQSSQADESFGALTGDGQAAKAPRLTAEEDEDYRQHPASQPSAAAPLRPPPDSQAQRLPEEELDVVTSLRTKRMTRMLQQQQDLPHVLGDNTMGGGRDKGTGTGSEQAPPRQKPRNRRS